MSYRGRHVSLRRSKHVPWLLVPFMVTALAKDNTGEFRVIAQEASDATPPPFHAQDFHLNPMHFKRVIPKRKRVAAPKLKPKPPPSKPKPKPKPESSQRVLNRRQQILQAARNLLGIPYVLGGEDRSGIDCSGFTQLVYDAVGIHLPRTAAEQADKYPRVSSPLPGDLVAWNDPATHVMIYYGNGLVIGAHHTGTVSSISPIYGSPSFHRVVS